MTRLRLVLLGLLAVSVVGAVASASASAAECKKEANGKFILCLGEPLILTEGTLTIHIKTDPETTSVLTSASGVKLLSKTIDESLAALTSLAASGVSIQGLVLHFTGVTVDEPAHCAVTNGLVKTELLLGRPEGKEKVLFQPATGKTFATIKIESSGGTCITAGNFNVTLTGEKGGVLCTSPIEVTRLEQLFSCKGVELKFGEEAATFEGDFIATLLKNNAAEKWAVIEGK